jgi:hypothetical protein
MRPHDRAQPRTASFASSADEDTLLTARESAPAVPASCRRQQGAEKTPADNPRVNVINNLRAPPLERLDRALYNDHHKRHYVAEGLEP